MGTLTLAATSRTAEAVSISDDWPHTKRPLPWLLTAFLAMLFLVPFQAIKFKLHLPADATPDRLLIVVTVVTILFSADLRRRRQRLGVVEYAVLMFAGVALISVVVNASRLYRLDYLSFVEKGELQLLSFIALFFIVVKVVRSTELRALSRLILWLSCATSLGVLLESRKGYNVFYSLAGKVLSPLATVAPSPTDIHPINGAKVMVVGPTEHPLALASLLTMALPFAIIPLLNATTPRQRVRYAIAIALIVAATLSTHEKTAMLAPLTVIIVLAMFRPEMLRWLPLGILVLIPMVHFAAPGVLSDFKYLIPGGNNYSDGRTADYSAIKPDLLSNLLIGRGFGSLDPLNMRWYRILDNEYLGVAWETGVIGLTAYAWMLCAPIWVARRLNRLAVLNADTAVAAAAGCAAFATVSATYDAMAFGQAIYAFLFAAALVAVVAGAEFSRNVPPHGIPPDLDGRRSRRPADPHRLRPGSASTVTPVGSSRS